MAIVRREAGNGEKGGPKIETYCGKPARVERGGNAQDQTCLDRYEQKA